jgi:hypothetical protein
MTATDTRRATARRNTMQKHRHGLRRIDYFPGAEAARAIDDWLRRHPADTYGSALDVLILAGAASFRKLP